MDQKIIVLIVVIILCSCLSLSIGVGYYYTQSTQVTPMVADKQKSTDIQPVQSPVQSTLPTAATQLVQLQAQQAQATEAAQLQAQQQAQATQAAQLQAQQAAAQLQATQQVSQLQAQQQAAQLQAQKSAQQTAQLQAQQAAAQAQLQAQQAAELQAKQVAQLKAQQAIDYEKKYQEYLLNKESYKRWKNVHDQWASGTGNYGWITDRKNNYRNEKKRWKNCVAWNDARNRRHDDWCSNDIGNGWYHDIESAEGGNCSPGFGYGVCKRENWKVEEDARDEIYKNEPKTDPNNGNKYWLGVNEPQPPMTIAAQTTQATSVSNALKAISAVVAVVNNNTTLKANGNSAYCVDIPNGDAKDGNQVALWKCNNTSAQKFTYDWNTKEIKNPPSGKCLDLTSDNKVIIHTCHKGDNQKWDRVGNAFKSQGKCMDIPGGEFKEGNKIQGYDCNNTSAQSFVIN